ncbi:MAG: hypothetical protein ACR2PR_06365, partial [Pseudohongiellaceae bacterium]
LFCAFAAPRNKLPIPLRKMLFVKRQPIKAQRAITLAAVLEIKEGIASRTKPIIRLPLKQLIAL